MPTGIYIRTEEEIRRIRENAYKMGKASKTQKQIEAAREVCRKLGKRPKTDRQREVGRRTGRQNGPINIKKAQKVSWKLPRSKAQLEAYRRKNRTNANTPVEHHNDLCHGALRPDDVTYMTVREHSRLHAKLQCEDRERDNKGRFN